MKNLEYYLNLNYEIKIRKLSDDEGGGWFAEIPLLPGCMSDGETSQEAIANVNDAKKDWLQSSLELGRFIPEPANMLHAKGDGSRCRILGLTGKDKPRQSPKE